MSLLPENLERYKKVISFLLKYKNSDVFKSVQNNTQVFVTNNDEETYNEDQADQFVEDLKKMGPTYVKLGQTLSTRPDLLPDNYLKALITLQDDVEYIPFEEIKSIVEEEIGTKISKAFQNFEEKPIASASIGQVHKAILRSGKVVAVKVQRTGIRKKFIEELETLQEMANLAVKHTNVGKKYALDDVIEELKYILLNELDYTKEAQNLITLNKNLSKFDNIIVPLPVLDYSSSKVLTMDFVEGKKITNINPLLKTEINHEYLVDELLESYLKQVILDGFAHADPHPGNVYINSENKIILMDLGMVARFNPTLQDNIVKLLLATSNFDGNEVSNVLLNISKYDKSADISKFTKEINRLVLESQSKTAQHLQIGKLLIQMNKIAANNGVQISVELNILGKILLNMDQIVAFLSPNYDLQTAIKTKVKKLMKKKISRNSKPENFFTELIETKKFITKLPERLNLISERLANNELEIKIDAIDEQRLTDGFQKIANRITTGLIIAALIIGASFLMRIPSKYTILGYPSLAMILLMLATFFAFWFIIRVLIKDEDFRKKK